MHLKISYSTSHSKSVLPITSQLQFGPGLWAEARFTSAGKKTSRNRILRGWATSRDCFYGRTDAGNDIWKTHLCLGELSWQMWCAQPFSCVAPAVTEFHSIQFPYQMSMRKTPAFFGEANLLSKHPLSTERWSNRYYIMYQNYPNLAWLEGWFMMYDYFPVGRRSYVFRNSQENCSYLATILISWNSSACKTLLFLLHHNDSHMCECQ